MLTHIPVHKGSLMFAVAEYNLLSTELLDHHTVILGVISKVQFPVLQKKGERGHKLLGCMALDWIVSLQGTSLGQ